MSTSSIIDDCTSAVLNHLPPCYQSVRFDALKYFEIILINTRDENVTA